MRPATTLIQITEYQTDKPRCGFMQAQVWQAAVSSKCVTLLCDAQYEQHFKRIQEALHVSEEAC